MATQIVVVVLKLREMLPTRNRRNRALFTWQNNKISAAFPTVAAARITPKVCQGRPPAMYRQCSKSVQFWRVI